MIQIQASEAMASQLSTSSPSFNSYSSETLADIAARVLNELRRDPPPGGGGDHDDLLFDPWQSLDFPQSRHDSQIEDEFEFALVCSDPNSPPVSADDIFCNGQIKPMYPIFDSNLLFNHSQIAESNDFVLVAEASVSPIPPPNQTLATPRLRRPPLRKLMFEERETLSCSSSASDADEIDAVAGGGAPVSYCVWSPKSASAGRTSKKNTSTGTSSSSSSSRRWRLRDLLVRNGSHGSGRKESTVFVSQSKRSSKVAQEVSKPISGTGAGGEHDVRKGEQTKKKKKSSLLPYRQELVGMFGNVNGIGRSLHPF